MGSEALPEQVSPRSLQEVNEQLPCKILYCTRVYGTENNMPRQKTNSTIGIFGYGEVGKAIAKFYTSPKIKDLKRDDGLEGIEVLHVCIPWSNKFIPIVEKEIKVTKSQLSIIHSTVAPGTTKELISKLPKELQRVVHSPIRGVHPHLYEGIKTFVKYIGAEDEGTGRLAQQHLCSIGMKTKVFTPTVVTELGKLFCTSYYGLCIAWHGEMKKMCDKFGVDFGKAVTDFNQSYNEGYTKLGKKNVVRPTLYAPPGGIGGHCIIPNAQLLEESFPSKALELILEYKPKTVGFLPRKKDH